MTIPSNPATSGIHSDDDNESPFDTSRFSASVKLSSEEHIRTCIQQGLDISERLMKRSTAEAESSSSSALSSSGRGGRWEFTIGLCGKPSAGKSTFFNTATAFARQRDDRDNVLGGATMAPHPFTTIDPNVGYCLVPAPAGSCPEDGYKGELSIGCTHGRDHQHRRLIPVLLKDVAGLVPGAYQGRGRGNKFLNDLTDADILIHVVDASGLSDEGGNLMGSEDEGASHPLHDLAWVRKELIEWVCANLMFKWDVIRRRGRSKLSDMFSGYGQPQQVTWDVLNAVEEFMETAEHRGDHPLDHLDEWDEGDIHRLVSAFLAIRFPMVLALNKADLPSSEKYISDILAALPVHGAHVAVPVSAREEMHFVRKYVVQAKLGPNAELTDQTPTGKAPTGVWQCLQSALTIKEPILVFPVCDFKTYAPLVGLDKLAAMDPSLPSAGMNGCLTEAGGCAPSAWDPHLRTYQLPSSASSSPSPSSSSSLSGGKNGSLCALRDVLVLKPGSTVEDAFLALKRLGALRGDFIRAEGAGDIGEAAKPVPKQQKITRSIRILRMMTNQKIP
jgi:hypothetical protein